MKPPKYSDKKRVFITRFIFLILLLTIGYPKNCVPSDFPRIFDRALADNNGLYLQNLNKVCIFTA